MIRFLLLKRFQCLSWSSGQVKKWSSIIPKTPFFALTSLNARLKLMIRRATIFLSNKTHFDTSFLRIWKNLLPHYQCIIKKPCRKLNYLKSFIIWKMKGYIVDHKNIISRVNSNKAWRELQVLARFQYWRWFLLKIR